MSKKKTYSEALQKRMNSEGFRKMETTMTIEEAREILKSCNKETTKKRKI